MPAQNPFVSEAKKAVAAPEKKAARTKASTTENSKSNPIVGFRADDEERAMIEALRLRLGKKLGRIPSASDVLRQALREMNAKRD